MEPLKNIIQTLKCFNVVASNGKDGNKRKILVIANSITEVLDKLSRYETDQYKIVHSVEDIGICLF